MLIVAVLFLGVTAVIAQGNKKQAQRNRAEVRTEFSAEDLAKRQVSNLEKSIELTEQQKRDIYAVYLKRAELKKERISQNAELQKQINMILTDEQQEKLKQRKIEKMSETKERRIERRASDKR